MRRWEKLMVAAAGTLVIAAGLREARTPAPLRTGRGRVLGIPYDLRLPTPRRVVAGLWAPDDERLLIERGPWGLGWSVNLARLRPHRVHPARRGAARR